MQLAQAAGDQRHIDPGELLRDGKLGDRRLLGGAAIEGFGRHLSQGEAEGGKLGPVKGLWRWPKGRLGGLVEGAGARTGGNKASHGGPAKHMAA